MSILIVDDEVEIRRLFEEYFSIMEVNSFAVGTADEAREKMKNINDIDLIMLDLHMPGMKGEDFLNELKQKKINIPVFIITGNTDADVINRLEKLGCAEIIIKPVKLNEVMQLLGKHLPST